MLNFYLFKFTVKSLIKELPIIQSSVYRLIGILDDSGESTTEMFEIDAPDVESPYIIDSIKRSFTELTKYTMMIIFIYQFYESINKNKKLSSSLKKTARYGTGKMASFKAVVGGLTDFIKTLEENSQLSEGMFDKLKNSMGMLAPPAVVSKYVNMMLKSAYSWK